MNTAIVALYLLNALFSLHYNIPYPKDLILQFGQRWVKILAYFAVFLLSTYDRPSSLFLLFFVVFLHVNELLLVNAKYKI